MNWVTHGGEFTWKGLGYFGVGALAGAAGAGVGAGISSAITGGSFGAGFIGSSAAMSASSSFISGAAIGGGAGFSSGFITGAGNSWMGGNSFGQGLWDGTKTGLISGTIGAAMGGIGGGIRASIKGKNFWTGKDPYYEANIKNYKVIYQTDNENCKNASLTSIEKVKGGTRNYEDFVQLEEEFKKTLPLGGRFGYNVNDYFDYTGLDYQSILLDDYSIYELGSEISKGNPIMLLESIGNEEYHAVTMYRMRQWTPTSSMRIWYGDPLRGNVNRIWNIFNFNKIAFIFR
jgi:hypothetical protein